MARGVKILLGVGAGMVVLLALCLLVLLTFDWNRARPWINTRVSETIGRPFAIDGDLSLAWQHPDQPLPGWRGWIPWPQVRARDVRVGNPEWAHAAPNMATIGEVRFALDPLQLPNKKAVIPALQLGSPNLTLERHADGRSNWTFALPQEREPGWQVDLQQLQLDQGRVRLVDAFRHADVTARINTLAPAGNGPYRIGWKLDGSFNHESVSGSGKAGAILSLRDAQAAYPLEADLQVGKTFIGIKGHLTDPARLAALDLRLRVSGVSMAHLYPIIGIVLPETRPFSTEGHLIGNLNRAGGDWKYEKFNGRMGGSDLSGTLEFHARQPRPLLQGSVVSNLLLFEDLAPLIGADSRTSKIARGAAPDQPAGKVLPVEPFRTERWRSIDAEVSFSGRKIVRSKALPIDDLFTRVRLQDGVLHLAPLVFGVAGGKLISDIRLDGRESLIHSKLDIELQGLQLKQLFPTFSPMQASLGEINGNASLSATGNSVAALLGASNGELKALISKGHISKLLLEEIGLNLGNVVLAKLFGDRQVRLNCLAGDFAVTRGVMQARTLVLDTEDATINVTGQIDLARERLNLTIEPDSKGLRVISLRAPLYVRGTFRNPQVEIDKGVLAMRAGGAAVLAALAPVLTAVLPLVNLGDHSDAECGRLLREARKKPRAPAPGKSLQGAGSAAK